MKTYPCTRREFLKLLSYGLGSFAFAPFLERLHSPAGLQLLRVTARQVKIYQQPDWNSAVAYTRARDELVHAYYPLHAGKGRNTLWYRVWAGYAHSAALQPVESRLNTPLTSLPENGLLAEVSLPYTGTMLLDEKRRLWTPNYRLYYGSTHWLAGLEEGPDAQPWYRIKDSFERTYLAPAVAMRPIPASELSPLSPGLAPEDKTIQVSIEEQTLRAYERGRLVLETLVSTGLPQVEPPGPDEIPSETPLGDFHITVKTPSRHMGDKKLSADLETLALPGVPWVSFFKKEGYSLHGTYWHANFGYRMSHGCVNMRPEDARWVYRWTEPVVPEGETWYSDWGTRVSII